MSSIANNQDTPKEVGTEVEPLAPGGGQRFMRHQLIAGRQHRGAGAINQILANNPNLVAFTMFITHRDDNREGNFPGSINSDIWNDGRRICYAPAFEQRPLMTKIALVIKHLLKIALCHPQRGRRMKRLMAENFDERLFIFSSDLVIHQSFVTDPSKKYEKLTPTLEEVLKRYLNWCKTVELPQPTFRPAAAWSIEDTYYFINRWREQMKEKAEESGIGADDIDWLQALLASLAIDIDFWSPEAMGGKSADNMDQDDNDSMLKWGNVFRSAQAGDKPGGILRSLTGDIPILKTPWKSILRSDTLRAVSRQPRRDWTRPSRDYITKMVMGQKNMPLEPARARNQASPKIAILADTSGSVDDATLTIFAAAMNGVQRAKKTQLRLIIGDTKVEEIVDIRPDQLGDVCKKIQFKGKGGTDFRPLIEAAVEWKPDIIVYLTDLQGTFPDKAPPCTMIWAVLPAPGTDVTSMAPWGKVIMLE